MNATESIQRADRRAFVRTLLAATPDALVVTGLGSSAYDVFAAGDRDTNYYLWGAMGAATGIGLGLALAQPQKSVVVITGDGEQLMGIGTLGSIAVKRPNNLTIVVLDNGHFGETGMQRSHSSLGTDLVAVAKGFGISHAFSTNSVDRCEEIATGIRRRERTTFVQVFIEADEPPRALPPRDGPFIKNRFRAALGLKPFWPATTMQRYRLRIAGESVDPQGGGWFETQNPYTGQAWAEIPRGDARDVDAAVQAAHRALTTGPWSEMTATQRGALMRKLADLIARDAAKLAATEVRDNGKLYAEMLGQLNYIPQWFHYYGGLADKIQGATLPLDKKGYFAFTRHEPVGVVAAITPWNSPLLLATWKIAPALAAGCTVVVKPSEFTSASTLEFAELFDEAGFPPGVFNVVTGFGAEVGTPLVEHPLVAKVSFTGSDATGRVINEKAARLLKHTAMELGGKSPNIVFDDADLEQAVFGAVSGIFAAAGQTCIAGSRLLVQDSIHDAFVEKLLAVARSARMGDPMDAATQVGPVTTPPQYRKVLDYIDIARSEGATAVLGGEKGSAPECGSGWFVQPTVFTGVRNDMRIAQEEVFGPVLSVIRFSDEADALRIANDVRFGLAAAVWTKDIGRAIRMSERLQAGTVWVNTYRAVSFMAPFGGYKDSGLGRENGIDAVREYLQTKSVWINSGAVAGNPFVLS